jgi:hypothetical protein
MIFITAAIFTTSLSAYTAHEFVIVVMVLVIFTVINITLHLQQHHRQTLSIPK